VQLIANENIKHLIYQLISLLTNCTTTNRATLGQSRTRQQMHWCNARDAIGIGT